MSDPTEAPVDPEQIRRIYLDHAASTPVEPVVRAAMEPYWSDSFGNQGAIHSEGQAAKAAIEGARERVAAALGAHADEITFTGSGTEANNLAIFGVAEAVCAQLETSLPHLHLITSQVEHSSVLDCFKHLEEQGAQVTYLPVDAEGWVDPRELAAALRDDTVLVSLMYVNSEIGNYYPLDAFADVIRAHRRETRVYPLAFHTDASQGPTYFATNVDALGVDLLTIDAQKMYGPKGIGALYHRRGTPLAPQLFGGGQEKGMRPGTPATPLIAGLAASLELVAERRASESERLTALRDAFIADVEARVPAASLNGPRTDRSPNNVSFSFPGFDAEELVLRLDAKGVAVSTKSVCRGTHGSSHVIAALGKGQEHATSMLRFSLGHSTTKEDLSQTVEALFEVIQRQLSSR